MFFTISSWPLAQTAHPTINTFQVAHSPKHQFLTSCPSSQVVKIAPTNKIFHGATNG